jgi:hypothetical protein
VASLTDAQLAAIAQLTHSFDASGVEHWFFGGWGVDLAVGRVTRAHDDVDVVVWEHDGARVCDLLDAADWNREPDHYPDEGSRHSRNGVLLEITYVVRDAAGALRTPGRWSGLEWPADSFGARRGAIGGVSAPIVEVATMIAMKEGFDEVLGSRPHGAKDLADLAALRTLPD